MIMTTLQMWREWGPQYSLLPYAESIPIPAGRSVGSWAKLWRKAGEYAFVLESGKSGRYTYFGLHPHSAIEGKGRRATISSLTNGSTSDPTSGPISSHSDLIRRTDFPMEADPMQAVKEWMKEYRAPKVPGAPKFLGGCVGYMSYDVARSLERIPATAEDDLHIPDYSFMMIRRLWVIDHEQQRLICAVHMPSPGTIMQREQSGQNDSDKRRLSEGEQAVDYEDALRRVYDSAQTAAAWMKEQWSEILNGDHGEEAEAVPGSDRTTAEIGLGISGVQSDPEPSSFRDLQIDIDAIPGRKVAFSKDEYMAAVRRIQDYIRQGDVFQVNLSVRQSRELRSDPTQIYEWLRRVNPSPYMGMVRFPDMQLVSASPELLVKLEDGILTTRPIAGTRPRGKDADEDASNAQDLIGNEKERAEHVMLVDLLRNDLGRVSEYGSVKVSDFMVIERYSHVMHIVSEVKGTLAADKDGYDALAAAFPGGTITGAPKVRTMEIIEELEPVRRGPYTGSIGWIDYNGNMEFNIAIRTLVAKDGSAHIQAGAGIVIDSDPEREYAESLQKAKALWKAVMLSESEQHL